VSEACCEFHPPKGTPENRLPCPRCGTPGKPVERITLGALLKPEARPRIPSGERFWFCASPVCEVVYFDAGGAVFTKPDLSVRVGIKEPEDPKPLCYCFGFTEANRMKKLKGSVTRPHRRHPLVDYQRLAHLLFDGVERV